MAMSSQDSLRIIDKRQSISGTEYLFNSGDWISSSTSRCVNPELVELYEYLYNSGFREGANVFNPLLRPRLVLPKGIRKRVQSSSEPVIASSPATTVAALTQTNLSASGSQEVNATLSAEQNDQDAEQIANMSFDQETSQSIQESDSSTSAQPPSKKPRIATLRREESLGLSQLSIESMQDNEDNSDSRLASPSTSALSSPKGADQKSSAEDSGNPPTPTLGFKQNKKDMAVVEFNKNTENMITIYFKSGLDATGVEMIDMVLGPLRRPSKDFIAAFFYAVILSPLTESATIEAAIHVLDRTLTLHGPEPFQAIWDVQKRRREFADGSNPFSKTSSSSDVDSDIRTSSRSSAVNKKPLTLRDLSSAALAGRLPSWNDTWDLIKAEFGLDTREESKQHISLQEHQIRLRLEGGEAAVEVELPSKDVDDEDLVQGEDNKSGKVITEEQEIREEVGRAIVGLLLRVLEQDAVLSNMSRTSFFCRDVLCISRYSPNHTTRQTLDLAFQIVGLATSSRYFEPHPRLNPTTPSTSKPLGKSARTTFPWPVNERCILSAAGLEILQLGQQIILLLVRFAEAGELLTGKGLEELAREVISRLSKVNRDRKLPSTSSGGRGASFMSPFFLERYNLDQTEVFLKTLIQGPCLLEAGTGSGASVKLRRDAVQGQQGTATDSVGVEQEENHGMFKSQIGVCTGSSVFVMILVDYWFRNNTTANNPGTLLSFRAVVEKYTAPGQLRPSTLATASTTTTPGKPVGTRKTTRGTVAKKELSDDEVHLTSTEGNDDQPSYAQWNPKDLEEIEWTVMMTEVLVWAWIEARGIRRDEIQNTGLEQVLFPEEVGTPSLKKHPESGWLLMSEVLGRVGGTLKTRWEQLESVIEAALLVEDLGLR
ncbi:hypothetical protein BGZ95_010260 [Linnemannia exigua]|uniref:Uncharacterized protein n=1 Tax=Linnemannia exigua TaxID=604196 RepID=A0AAD4DBJ0_9FUNG|nr:hypothetical protein BGZ95_010260 [Linnemannia exigua]